MVELVKYSDCFKAQTVKRIADFFGFHSSLLNDDNELNEVNYEMASETLCEWLLPPSELYMISLFEEVIGFLRLSYRGSNVAWIEDIYIDPKHRSKGYATQAIKVAEEKIKADPNYTAICFDVVPRNEAAMKLYHKLGYDSLSIITVRKELGENKRNRTIKISGLDFKY